MIQYRYCAHDYCFTIIMGEVEDLCDNCQLEDPEHDCAYCDNCDDDSKYQEDYDLES